MTLLITHLIFSFISAACFGMILNAPRKSLLQCGLVGTVGWMFYFVMTEQGIDVVQAAFCGAFAVAIIGHIFARLYKTPIIVFIVAGIIPLVPGGSAYDAMRHVVSSDYSGAIPLATKAFIISGSIAMGLVFAEVLVQLILKRKKMKVKAKESV